MSVSHGILSLLEERPQHGYGLREQFEAATGGTWPLNVGQVYTTLGRLERDGMVEPDGATDAHGRNAYRITDDGRAQLGRWYAEPIARDGSAREELVAKVALAVANPAVDARRVIHVQRAETMRAMQVLTQRKRVASQAGDVAQRLVLDSQLFHAEAEVRWLDHCIAQIPEAPTMPTEGTT
ncbi:MAG: transcriptional regulator [Thermoleophilia bacterium]|nr:transcriptional regulator [Thermoleophilia bacterium]